MEYLFITVLISLPTPFLAKTATACYGSGLNCHFLTLECQPITRLQITRAEFRRKSTADCKELGNCSPSYQDKCCKAEETDFKLSFNAVQIDTLQTTCIQEGKVICKIRANHTNIRGEPSRLVLVNYHCENKDVLPEVTTAGHEDNNTAAIVVPIVIVLLIVVVGLGFFYWRRKKSLENTGKTEKGEGNGALPAPVHNASYDYKEQNKDTSKSADTEHIDDETVYHTIDPNSIPDKVVANDYLELDPADDYNVIGASEADNKTVANDYFILEPQGNHIDKEEVDYNKINLKANKIVQDPNYQRLASVDQNRKDEVNADNENYSHLGDKLAAEKTDGHIETDNKGDDYAHLNKDSI